jgi:septin family protein
LGGAKLNKTKPFCISKKSVMAAWERVKANKGTCGIDEESIEDFELKKLLFNFALTVYKNSTSNQVTKNFKFDSFKLK